jgi:hypothetical protein
MEVSSHGMICLASRCSKATSSFETLTTLTRTPGKCTYEEGITAHYYQVHVYPEIVMGSSN